MKKFNNFSERAIISELKKIHRELKDANRKVKDDTWFEDDPRAVKEKIMKEFITNLLLRHLREVVQNYQI